MVVYLYSDKQLNYIIMKTQIEYNEKMSFLVHLVEKLNTETSVNWNNLSKAERIYKNNYKINYLNGRLEYLHTWLLNIGKEVFISKSSFNYTLVESFSKLDSLNSNLFDSTKSIIFYKEVFERLCFDYLDFQIKHITERLVNRPITSNSSCKISNLIFEWELECSQDLIELFNEALTKK